MANKHSAQEDVSREVEVRRREEEKSRVVEKKRQNGRSEET